MDRRHVEGVGRADGSHEGEIEHRAAHADHPAGPWTKHPDNPWLVSGRDVLGPGHVCLTPTGDGARTLLVRHGKDWQVWIARRSATKHVDPGMLAPVEHREQIGIGDGEPALQIIVALQMRR